MPAAHLLLYSPVLVLGPGVGDPCPRPRVKVCSSMLPPTGEILSLLKLAHTVWKRWLHLQMYRCLHKAARIMKNQGNVTQPKEHGKLAITDPQKMEIHRLSNK